MEIGSIEVKCCEVRCVKEMSLVSSSSSDLVVRSLYGEHNSGVT